MRRLRSSNRSAWRWRISRRRSLRTDARSNEASGRRRCSEVRRGALDRYAARCSNFVLVVTRIAVLGARSAPRDTGNQPRAHSGYQWQSPWLVLVLLCASMAPVRAQSPPSAAARAFQHAYNLDYDGATGELEAAAAANPRDIAVERGLAVVPWLMITFRRGAVTVDDYLGSISKQNVALREPPADLAERFARHSARALQLAEEAVRARPNEAEAQYQLGAVVGLQASYSATVEGRVLGAFRAARRAYEAHERVMRLDPSRKDAGLIVGMYRYIVSQLSLPIRMMADLVGFGGGKELGIRMIEDAARHPGDSQADARFALVLLYNRERRYDDALRVLGQLQEAFPRNRILWLEAGATALRAGRAADAERLLDEGLQRLATDRRPRMFGEEALWYLKRGTARVAL